MIDIEEWLAPIEGDTASGVSLRDDGAFHALEREVTIEVPSDEKNKAEAYGRALDAVDWSELMSGARELAGKGRDFRLLVIVTRALAHTDGHAGLAQGFELIAKSLDQYWEDAHPALREGRPPKEAALRRINALMQLENDDYGLLADLKHRAVITPRGIGPLTGRDLAQAGLDMNTVMREAPSGLGEAEKAAIATAHETLVNRVTAGCRAEADMNADNMASVQAGLEAALAALGEIERVIQEKLGADVPGVKFGELGQHLSRVQATLAKVTVGEAGDEVAETPVTNVTETPASADIGSAPQAAASGGIPGRLNSRKDVEKCLDLIIEFYERTEPSSPLPHIAKRMRRMVPMDFLELIEEVAPGGIKDFQVAVGARDSKK